MIWTLGAIHALPVTLLDIVIVGFFVSLARTTASPRTQRTTRLLGLWFLSLFFVNGFHVATCLVLSPWPSFLLNRVGESVAVLLSTIPLVAFSYAFIDEPSTRREARIVTAAVSVVAVAVSLVFTVTSFQAASSSLFWRVAVEHTESSETNGWYGLALMVVVLGSYALASVVLVRKGLRAEGRDRASALAFAGIALAAVVAAFINRMEGMGLLPMGTYTTWTLVAMLGAVVVYMGHSEDFLRFAERIVGITLTLLLVVSGVAGELVVSMRAEREDAVRHALVETARTLWNSGQRHEARHIAGAVDPVAPDVDEGMPLSATMITERFTANDGSVVELHFSQEARARAISETASRVALVMALVTVLSLLTLRRLLEQAVLAPLRILERADASSRAKSLFIAQLSHELRTPLSAVVGHARSLEGTSTPGSDERIRARRIAEAAENLLILVEGLLEDGKANLSSIVPRQEHVDLAGLVQSVADLASARAAGKPVTVSVDVASDVGPSLSTDPRLLRQIVLNLMTNAIKNTEEGSVTCRVTALPGAVRFTVEDTGVGIAPAEHGRIFLPFHQVAAGEGAGLGLAVVKHFASALGTHVHLDSALGAGARFWFDLPTRAAAAPATSSAVELPRGDVRVELLELAMVGDVVAIKDRARALASADGRYRGFAERVDALVDSYQVRALQALLEDAS